LKIDIDQYREQGFVLIRNFFDPEKIARIHADAKEIFAVQMRQLGLLPEGEVDEAEFNAGMFQLFERDVSAIFRCGKHCQHLISLHRLSLDERITSVLKELGLAFPNISTRPTLYFNHPRLAEKEVYWRLDLHQDWRSMQGSLDSVVVWVPLIDIDKDLGALEILPGSHKRGLVNAEMIDGYGHFQEAVDTSGLLRVDVKRGDALFFSAFMIHKSGTNSTESIRWSCHFRYNNLYEKTFIERGYPHPYIYRPQTELIYPGFPNETQIKDMFAPAVKKE
jgi:ectoine hydroxylase-related dioxygenase (phytanoyl-CoA dioxygenase family)